LPRLQRDLLAFVVECSQRYGDVVPLQFGPQRVLLLTHPDDIETVLVGKHRSFMKGRFYRLLEPMLGQGLFTSEGSFWLRQRRLAAPAFHRDRIARYALIMSDYARQLVASWSGAQQRDVFEDMMGLTLRIVGKALFDADIARDAPELGVAVGIALAQLNSEIYGLPLLIPQSWPTPGRRRLRRAIDRLDRIVFDLIAERRNDPQRHTDLLSTLMAAQDDDGSRMTDRQLRDEAATLIMAGHETSALALSWAWYLLATNPDVEARLHQEVDSVLNGRLPELADLPRLPYSEMIIKEALRLYPPAVEFGRETLEPCDVGGYHLPPGTVVFTSPWVVQRDERWFDEPNRFWPERWTHGLAQRIPRFAFLPFGGGPRVCMGQAFASMETVLVLATVAQRYRLTLAPGARIEPLPSLTLRFKHGLPMQLQRRER
jgi:cytochrome P450